MLTILILYSSMGPMIRMFRMSVRWEWHSRWGEPAGRLNYILLLAEGMCLI